MDIKKILKTTLIIPCFYAVSAMPVAAQDLIGVFNKTLEQKLVEFKYDDMKWENPFFRKAYDYEKFFVEEHGPQSQDETVYWDEHADRVVDAYFDAIFDAFRATPTGEYLDEWEKDIKSRLKFRMEKFDRDESPRFTLAGFSIWGANVEENDIHVRHIDEKRKKEYDMSLGITLHTNADLDAMVEPEFEMRARGWNFRLAHDFGTDELTLNLNNRNREKEFNYKNFGYEFTVDTDERRYMLEIVGYIW